MPAVQGFHTHTALAEGLRELFRRLATSWRLAGLLARFSDNDREDIHSLARLGLTTADAISQRANEAFGGYVGGQAMLLLNLRDAVALARRAEMESAAGTVKPK